MFSDPFEHAIAKRGELASLRTTPLFNAPCVLWVPRETSKYLIFSSIHLTDKHAKVELLFFKNYILLFSGRCIDNRFFPQSFPQLFII